MKKELIYKDIPNRHIFFQILIINHHKSHNLILLFTRRATKRQTIQRTLQLTELITVKILVHSWYCYFLDELKHLLQNVKLVKSQADLGCNG